jgi:hypothetical protein
VSYGLRDSNAWKNSFQWLEKWARQDGGRPRLQELLLEDYAALNRLKLKAE